MDHNRNALNESIYIIKYWQVIFFSNQTIHNLVGAIQKVLKGRFRAHQNGQ